ncbi:hypothetical protein [Hymenobacter properus]|uniref:Uncharacterized protein n=1 Tax=Hymenobacter properus TaxID=2791026 RepID=A0A931BG49_9BACT|nr:hypothetical protein [Hymenobacter properus]MBF9143300.1 hypothetical protein [Hymenobacter properus]MBR7722110.1 hypothetical protein [Microvirga sp. SRT04]
MKASAFVLLLISGLPAAAIAQPNTAQGELLRRGELTGSRPSAKAQMQAASRPANHASDPAQQHLLQTDINLAQARAEELPNLYERFMATTRDERRTWTAPQWDAAGEVLARLNQRYEQVRTDLPLDDRLRVRSLQGEFHTLRGARNVKEKLE